MIIKAVVTICLLCFGLLSQCQELHEQGEITDSRDGKVYKTVKVLNTVWLAENMKFKTANSVSIGDTDNAVDLDGYYYPHYESDEACPSNFEIPKDSQWREYVEYIVLLKDIPT